jgi:hypothetical protein
VPGSVPAEILLALRTDSAMGERDIWAVLKQAAIEAEAATAGQAACGGSESAINAAAAAAAGQTTTNLQQQEADSTTRQGQRKRQGNCVMVT